MAGPPIKKAEHTRLTLSQQAKAALLLMSDTHEVHVVSQLGNSRRTVTSIKRNCDNITERAGKDSLSLN